MRKRAAFLRPAELSPGIHQKRLRGSLAPPVRNFTRRRHLGVYKAINGLISLFSQLFCPGRHNEIDFRTVCFHIGLELRVNFCSVGARDPSGFYEWKAEERGKIPYYIHPVAGSFVAFAGLYDTWKDPEGTEIPTVTIITKDADAFMARLHNRMPVVLAPEDEQPWIDPHLTIPSHALRLLAQSAGVSLDAYPVSRMVNKPSVDEASLIEPIEKTGP
jgi:hypothetical protein